MKKFSDDVMADEDKLWVGPIFFLHIFMFANCNVYLMYLLQSGFGSFICWLGFLYILQKGIQG